VIDTVALLPTVSETVKVHVPTADDVTVTVAPATLAVATPLHPLLV
jgi:hypothetical protein